MKKSLTAISLACLLTPFVSFSQIKSIGWYHLLPGTQTKLLANYVQPNSDGAYGAEEILLLFDFKGKKGYAVDIDGRIVEIQDTATIKRIETPGRVVKITKQINVTLDKKFNPNNNVWIVGFNSANNSAKVLLSSGETVEIPNDSYTDLRDYFDVMGKKYQPHNVVIQ